MCVKSLFYVHSAPRVDIPAMNQSAERGSSAVFSCTASGFPFAWFEWLKDGESVFQSDLSNDITVQVSAVKSYGIRCRIFFSNRKSFSDLHGCYRMSYSITGGCCRVLFFVIGCCCFRVLLCYMPPSSHVA